MEFTVRPPSSCVTIRFYWGFRLCTISSDHSQISINIRYLRYSQSLSSQHQTPSLEVAFVVTVSHMTVEATFRGEPFAAHRAEIWFLSSMDPAVHFHIVLDPECFVTDITLKRPLPGMCPDVIVETVLLTKRFTANISVRTWEWLLLWVHLEMLPQITMSHESVFNVAHSVSWKR